MNATEFCKHDDQLILVVGVLIDTELQDGGGQVEEQQGPRVVSFLEILLVRENFRRKTQIVGETIYRSVLVWSLMVACLSFDLADLMTAACCLHLFFQVELNDT